MNVPNRWGSKPPTALDNVVGMKSFLYGCRVNMLDGVSVDDLVRRHGVKPKIAEYELIVARQKRAGEAR